uniref:Interleukin-34 n=2 Tax=Callorhinchus milii TaxID=7868 RepID=A0A4W3JGM7_CALMI
MLRNCTKTLGLALLLVLVAADSDQMCRHLQELHNKLQFKQRVRYMKYYIPLNYTFKVHYEEIYRIKNTTRLQKQSFTEVDLKILWVYINSQVFKSILQILPRKHPSRRYVRSISKLFDYLRMEVRFMVMDLDERVEDIIDAVQGKDPESRRKDIKPKALLDNCYQVMI